MILYLTEKKHVIHFAVSSQVTYKPVMHCIPIWNDVIVLESYICKIINKIKVR